MARTIGIIPTAVTTATGTTSIVGSVTPLPSDPTGATWTIHMTVHQADPRDGFNDRCSSGLVSSEERFETTDGWYSSRIHPKPLR